MIKTILKFIILSCSTVFLCGLSCEEMSAPAWGVSVKNQSDKDIYVVSGLIWIDNGYYSTTELPHDSYHMTLVKAGQQGSFGYMFYNGVHAGDNDQFAIFVIDPDTLAKYSWDQLRKNKNYLKKYEFRGNTIPYEVIYP
ncbi:MAG: hypothetical protein LBM20_01130 [Rikenellaceae bacterium]|jgi:hypothetical protein|nr:hypothetical protein [Rikenellaceae bacterium]